MSSQTAYVKWEIFPEHPLKRDSREENVHLLQMQTYMTNITESQSSTKAFYSKQISLGKQECKELKSVPWTRSQCFSSLRHDVYVCQLEMTIPDQG